MEKGLKLILLGGSTFFATQGAQYLFYLTNNPILNLWTLYIFLLVILFIVKEVVRLLKEDEKKEKQ